MNPVHTLTSSLNVTDLGSHPHKEVSLSTSWTHAAREMYSNKQS